MPQHLALLALIASAGCATPYAYSFRLADSAAHAASAPGERDSLADADVQADILVDPTGVQAVLLDITNKTDQVLAVQWAEISLLAQDGSARPLRPDADLGWIEPGAKSTARLVPFVLPPSGAAAAAYDGQTFELDVPLIVRREPKLYRYSLAVQVRKRP